MALIYSLQLRLSAANNNIDYIKLEIHNFGTTSSSEYIFLSCFENHVGSITLANVKPFTAFT